MIDFVHFEQYRKGHIVADQFEIRLAEKMLYVLFSAGKKIIEAEHFIACCEQPLAEVRSEKSGASGYEYSHHFSSIVHGAWRAKKRLRSAPCSLCYFLPMP
jgi:hypothetical protein